MQPAAVLRRFGTMLVTLLGASLVAFGMMHILPGDAAAAMAGTTATPEQVAVIRHGLGLDRPLWLQYATWIAGVLHGDFGHSYTTGIANIRLISAAAVNTLQLAVAAMLVALTVGGVLGTAGATSRSRAVRVALTAGNTLFYAVPPYITGIVFVYVFAIALQVLPAGGHASLLRDPNAAIQYLLLPALCLGLPLSAVIGRFLQASLTQQLGQDYVRTAVAKGLAPGAIVRHHALRNALPPVVTIAGIQTGQLLGGAIVVEAVFAWPGLGQLAVQAVGNRDYLLVQDLLLIGVTVFVVLQAVTDLLHRLLDPRLGEPADG